MKKYISEEIYNHFLKEWPNDYYLADFILNWIINHSNYYYNYNKPQLFSLSGKGGKMYCIFDFINSVANTKHSVYKKCYKCIVQLLINDGAPNVLFNSSYCIN